MDSLRGFFVFPTKLLIFTNIFTDAFTPFFPIRIITMKKFSTKKSGFSLIELSIVLIIIGLLISGITGGASLIKSAEMRSVISEARAFATSVNGFYSQFYAYPGDYATQIGASWGGDNDNKIEYYTSASASTPLSPSENNVAWQQMKNAALIDGTFISSTSLVESTTAPTFGTHTPASRIKGGGWAFDYRDLTTAATAEANAQNVIVLSGAISLTVSGTASNIHAPTGAKSSGIILPSDALSIDTKIDDGIANAGKVRGVLTGCNGASTATYTTTTTTRACALSYQIDVNS